MSFRYETVTGFFAQDKPDNLPLPWDFLAESFGIIDRGPDRWRHLVTVLDNMRAEEPQCQFKLFYHSRHGQGVHNHATRFYGKELWNSKWCRKTGDPTAGLTWGPDAKLTAIGESQARAVNVALKKEVADGMPLPQSLYCSPLSRAIQTCQLQIGDILLDKGKRPLVMENCREHYGEHTCDKRSTKSQLQQKFPFLDFEEGFAEDDPCWQPDEKETFEHHMERSRAFLDHVFANDPNTVIGLYGHHGNSDTLFRVIGHEHYAVLAGEMIPFIVKATPIK